MKNVLTVEKKHCYQMTVRHQLEEICYAVLYYIYEVRIHSLFSHYPHLVQPQQGFQDSHGGFGNRGGL